ncbi:ABC1 kinase family protein [Nocardiopsis salina]|uniref:ABC1 kinase family protein n=1 Tax=Nocardiopsis salina TaxID=245836 RepID=UPI0004754AF8|nr:AarF/UbiB family protein [Nocardiopsis salina]
MAMPDIGAWIGQLLSVLVFVPILLLLGFLAGRMMGVPFSVPRLVFSGTVGMLLGSVLSVVLYYGSFEAANEQGDAYEPAFVAVVHVVMAALAMLVLVATELVVPRGTRVRPVAMALAIKDWVGRVRRYRTITWILARHGLWGYVGGGREGGEDASTQRRLARSLARSFEEAGVVFVKLGQVLATRRDLLPPVFVEELGRLHSEVAPVPFDAVRTRIEDELGRPLDDLFAEFEPVPLAAASIGQAHAARLHTGEQVVVKVQRPGIAPVVERDLDIIGRLARRFDEHTDWGPAIGVVDLADGFAEALREELDFEVEAANIAAMAEASAASPVRIPGVHEAWTSRRVLVMERFHGTPIGSVDPARMDGDRVAHGLLQCLLDQVLIKGIFHADPHPGNIFLLDTGEVGLLDHGSVGRLDGHTREALQLMMLAIDRADAVLLTDTLLDVATDADGVDAERLRRALGQFMVRYLNTGTGAHARMFTELLLVVTRFGLALPGELVAVFRALATVEGTLVRLSPGFDAVAEAKRFVSARVAERVNPEDLRDMALGEVVAMLPTLRRLPRRIDRITDQLHRGRFTVQVRPFAHPDDRRMVRDMVTRVVLMVLTVVTGLMSVGLFIATDGSQTAWAEMSIQAQVLDAGAWVLLGTAALMMLRLLVGVARDNTDRRR